MDEHTFDLLFCSLHWCQKQNLIFQLCRIRWSAIDEGSFKSMPLIIRINTGPIQRIMISFWITTTFRNHNIESMCTGESFLEFCLVCYTLNSWNKIISIWVTKTRRSFILWRHFGKAYQRISFLAFWSLSFCWLKFWEKRGNFYEYHI